MAWTINSAEADAQGQVVTLSVTATFSDGAFTGATRVDYKNSKAYPALVDPLDGWRYDADSGFLRPGPEHEITAAVVFEASPPVSLGGTNYSVTFKVALYLHKDYYIAINNTTGDVKITGLQSGWVVLKFSGGGSQKSADAQATPVTVTTSAVGKLPSGNLKVNVDSVAEATLRDNTTVNNVDTWHDLTAAYDLTGGPSSPTDYRPKLTAGTNTVPKMDFKLTSTNYFRHTSPPAIQNAATIAVVANPNTTDPTATLVGRYNGTLGSGFSWRVYYKGDAGTKQVVYQSRGSSTVTNDFDLLTGDDPFFELAHLRWRG